uniref:Transmembrane protein n=1 Tax=Hydrodictyon reticulatum TaxID=3107 RepID=A0A1W5RN25_HYDRE|nr:hypothetical protein [Hydrodictyon reticulatum]AQU64566.1 hypothetical protein [Hydrodictyon reticulatum]
MFYIFSLFLCNQRLFDCFISLSCGLIFGYSLCSMLLCSSFALLSALLRRSLRLRRSRCRCEGFAEAKEQIRKQSKRRANQSGEEQQSLCFFALPSFLRSSFALTASAEPMRRSGGFAEAKKRFGFAEKRRHRHRLCRSRSRSEEAVQLR